MAAAITSLANISKATKALTAAKSLEDVVQIRDQAEALRVYIKAAAEGIVAANAAAELKLRAERKAGEMLDAMEKNKGAAATRSHDATASTTLDDLGINKTQSSRWQQEASVPEEKFTEFLEYCRDNQREVTQAGLLNIAKGCHVSRNSGENEWYTPPEYIEAARKAMGSIDLDPASSEIAQQTVKATCFYTVDDDGLTKDWAGNVWLNPPYGKQLIGEFVEKLLSEASAINSAIVLVNNATDTGWFHSLMALSNAACFIRGRVKFLDKTGTPANTPLQGQAIFYIGEDEDSFAEQFRPFGWVYFNE